MKKYLFAFSISLLVIGCGTTPQQDTTSQPPEEEITQEAPNPQTPEEETTKGQKVTTSTGLQYEVFKLGTGPTAQKGDKVSVHYTGWLLDGTKFDSSVDRGTPFTFPLGARQVIKGWDEGVEGMQVGEERRLTIPSDLAYGNQDRGKYIKAGSTLVFDVELVAID